MLIDVGSFRLLRAEKSRVVSLLSDLFGQSVTMDLEYL